MAFWWALIVIAFAFVICKFLLMPIPSNVPSIDVDASDEGERWLKPEYRSSGRSMLHKKSKVEFHPLGVVGAIVSWNYPFHNLFNLVLAAVFSGNGIVVKIISNDCAYAVDGDVYLSVDNFPNYGKLSGRKLEDNRAGERIAFDLWSDSGLLIATMRYVYIYRSSRARTSGFP